MKGQKSETVAPKLKKRRPLATRFTMLGQKEICGLIVLLCCFLAHSFPIMDCDSCEICLLIKAKHLENAAMEFYTLPKNSEDIHPIDALFPSCDHRSKNKTYYIHIVKAFHTLFKQLNETIDHPKTKENLQRNLDQQAVCLEDWNLSDSLMNITYKESDESAKKVYLVKGSERYSCLMQQQLNT